MLNLLWIVLQVIIGFHLVMPLLFFWIYLFRSRRSVSRRHSDVEADYAIIITAYEQITTIPHVIDSILKLNYSNYVAYVVADKCDISTLNFKDDRIVILRPEEILGSNTKSHLYAVKHFKKHHDRITIIDSDNLLHPEYLNELNQMFDLEYQAVQGVRKAKNLNTKIAALDAARDLYYHFYDGKLLFAIGSSATLAGSGMAFERSLYEDFLAANQVNGAGFDKVLQAWLLKNKLRIAFSEKAVVYDEKTSKSDQLVNQRSRWINTWFKYFTVGFDIVGLGIRNLNRNQFLFGLVLLRPPLFLFILTSLVFLLINIFISFVGSVIWVSAFLSFFLGFYIALKRSNADPVIYNSLLDIPKFIFFQVVSLLKSKNANKRSVATTHYVDHSLDELDNTKPQS